MTEPLGVVASGIAVAQLGVATGGALLKLKQVWDQVEDAPDTISDLIERIDLIYPSVWDFEHQFTHSGLPPMLWDSSTAVRSVAYCRKALMNFSVVVDDLSTQVTSSRRFRRRLGAIRVVLKKDELKRLEGQLRNSLEVLQFAQNTYTSAVLTATPDILAFKMQQTMQLYEYRPSVLRPSEAEAFPQNVCEQEDERTLSHISSNAVSPVRPRSTSPWKPATAYGTLSVRKGPNEFDAEFRPPWWLTGLAKSFTLHLSTYRSSWDVQVRLYTERSHEDSVFFMAKDGDVAGLRSLFEQRKASPFDRDEYGWTLLHYALARCQLEVVKLLFETGPADLTQTTESGNTPIHLFGASFDSRDQDANELTRLLLPEVDAADMDLTLSELTCNCPESALWVAFRQWQPILCSFHDKTTLKSRLDRLYENRLADPEVYISLLSPEWSTDPGTLCNEVRTEYGYSLLHMAAINLTVYDANGTDYTKRYGFVKDILRMSTDLHPLEVGIDYAFAYDLPAMDITPLLRLILWYMSEESRYYLTLPRRSNKMLRKWIELMIEADVDIEMYGKRECELLQDTTPGSYIHLRARREFMESSDVNFPLDGCELCLYGLTYGPKVEDWRILCNEPTDQFAGEFWDLVEDRPLEIPGAWHD